MEALVSTQNLSRDFGALRAVRGVSFSLQQGDILGFLGPNGAGKSTTMRMISGTLAPTSGEVHLAGIDLAEHPRLAKNLLGYLPENPPLHDELTIDEYLQYCAGIRGVAVASRIDAVDRTRERCGLAGHGRRLIGNLSKGYRQRVGIAQAIVHNPRVIVLDEPTNGLDPIQIQEIRQLIRDLGEQRAIILSTHILPEVQKLCNRVLIMRGGSIVHTDDLSSSAPDARCLLLRLAENPPCARLADLEGVVGCHSTASGYYRLELRENRYTETIARQIVEQGWTLTELTPRRERLEEVFTRLINEESPG